MAKNVDRRTILLRKKEILCVLEDGKFYSRREIIAKLGLKNSTVATQKALDELVNTGQIEISDTYYSLSREVSA